MKSRPVNDQRIHAGAHETICSVCELAYEISQHLGADTGTLLPRRVRKASAAAAAA